MSTDTVRIQRSGRARKRARFVTFLDPILYLPAVFYLLTGGYSANRPTFVGVALLLMLGVSLIRSGLSQNKSKSDGVAFFGGLVALTAVFALVEQTGGLRNDLFPVLYAIIAVVVSFNSRKVALGLVFVAIVYETRLWLLVTGTAEARSAESLVVHLALFGLFAGLHSVFRTVEKRSSLQNSFSAPPSQSHPLSAEKTGPDGEMMLKRVTELVCAACGADCVSYLKLDTVKDLLQVSATTFADHLGVQISPYLGVFGGVLGSGKALVVNRVNQEFPGTLAGPAGRIPKHIMAAIVGRAERPIGVLTAQRWTNPGFDDDDLARLKASSKLIAQVLVARHEVDRVTDAHQELEQFFEASRLLNSALTPEEVFQYAVQAVEKIVRFQFCAITWCGDDERKHRVVHVCKMDNPAANDLVDTERSLAAMVVKTGHYLPLGNDFRPSGAPILVAGETTGKIESIIVLPLRMHDRVVGTLAIGTRQEHAFSDRRRGMLEVITNQVAVSLSNARTYARVQELATIDGLTELYNRRAFNQRLFEAAARQARSTNPLALVLMDIDHFKVINDTHGHPVGDVVLKKLGATIREMLRRTDTAARYGGEEFALILEDTATHGALVLAERLRKETARLSFTGAEGQTFQITISLGIAAIPADADEVDLLVEIADNALYEAKRSGRNQTKLASDVRSTGTGIPKWRSPQHSTAFTH